MKWRSAKEVVKVPLGEAVERMRAAAAGAAGRT